MLTQLISLTGAFLILFAYFLLQNHRVEEKSIVYLLLNLFGSLLLFYAALLSRQFGFILLEAAWVATTLFGILTRR